MKALVALLLSAGPLAAQDVPSGQQLTLHEVLVDQQDQVHYLRFRYIAPQIAAGAGQVGFDTSGDDMLHLCETFVLPYMVEYELSADKVVITFMDRITEFGVPDRDAVQYFEAFKTENGICMWDEF
ncbi:DUF6497 family protein [Sulfitobacter guttiformis]|uniref:Acetolactate synthase n=1 Tax=Sulfitobacter guttiformis TaxID=74349 RepID=A0A420DJX8_9RHOB|nr:DUF6497 family protein [Sulfitobacter guttiformis]KIN71624.1 hypothetical protein Z949_787 [Sulfitobacter guttiformis KCTC 32187]RKE94544.1 hypothetical protein C8N30_3672 [Sulfitobacter guttiformis]